MTCQGKVIDVDEVEDPIRESFHLSVDCQLHTLVHVDDGPDKYRAQFYKTFRRLFKLQAQSN